MGIPTIIQNFNAFKVSFKVVRENAKDIYKGFGFQHLSDVTQYYVHPNNQSYNSTTALCQPIGEAIILFATILKGITEGNVQGDYFISDDRNTVCLEVNIPKDYRENDVVDSRIFQYKEKCVGNKLTLSAHDRRGKWIKDDMKHLRPPI